MGKTDEQKHIITSRAVFVFTTRTARVLLFPVVSVCLFVCLFVCLSVCQHDNSSTVRDIITKFSGHHAVVERADKFENGYIGGD